MVSLSSRIADKLKQAVQTGFQRAGNGPSGDDRRNLSDNGGVAMIDEATWIAWEERCAALTRAHRFSVVMPAYRTQPEVLTAALNSVLRQVLPPSEVIVVDDSGQLSRIAETIASVVDPEKRIKLITNPQNMGISRSTNVGVEAAQGEFIFFVDHDDELTPDAFLCFAESIEQEPDCDAWYSDQCTVDEHGRLVFHFLKPDWSPVYATGAMYVGHLLAVRTELCREVPFRREFDGVQDFDFILRVSEKTRTIGHVRTVTYKWRGIEGSLALSGDEKAGIEPLQARAVNEHLARTGRTWRADVHHTLQHRLSLGPTRRTKEPRVSIVIPSRNHGEVLKLCLESIYTKTDYENFEVIVIDNKSTDPVAVEQLARFPVIRVPYLKKFNYSEANNIGVAASSGDLLLFLNNDTEVIESDWLRKLVMYFEDEDIGAVGATLLFPNETVQHAGVLLGPRGTADHLMRGFEKGSDGYAGSLAVAREVSAVTAACLMMRASTFREIGGFSTDYAKHYQDVDLCLKIRELGQRIVNAGNVRLVHYESLTRSAEGYDLGDRAILRDRWWEVLSSDPYYNPGFVEGSVDYQVRPGWIA